MKVVTSSAIGKKHRIYHRIGCKYVTRIKYHNRLEMTDEQATKKRYKECKCCSGLKGDVSVHKKNFKDLSRKHDMSFEYREDKNSLFVKTNIGFWKIYNPKKSTEYILYHRNTYNSGMNIEEAMKGAFHRQSDVKATDSLDKLVNYIVAHDRAKVIIMDDYRKLPRATKKQKKYYRKAENKDRKKKMKNLYSLFDALERENPELKKYSVG